MKKGFDFATGSAWRYAWDSPFRTKSLRNDGSGLAEAVLSAPTMADGI